MKPFLDKDFLLSNDVSKKLYHDYAAKMPIIDYHCHINPKEIWEDTKFQNITEIWLGGDHYKWRFMRSCGVEEYYITGAASPKEKFIKWATCLGTAIGNPLYHWSHLELRNYFGFEGALSAKNAEQVWDFCNQKILDTNMSARSLILDSNVAVVCTTDDPIDSLEYHQKIAADQEFSSKVAVLPAWRPDKAMNIEKEAYLDYLNSLSQVSGVAINSFKELCRALSIRMAYFKENGCVISDHGLEYVMYSPAVEEEIEAIFAKRLANEPISRQEELKFKTAFMLNMACEYTKLGWTMQLHYGVKRDNNTKQFLELGVDSGYDCINNYAPSSELVDFLNAVNSKQGLPKTILYSLNPNDNQAIGTIIGCFQNDEARGKIQHGSAWWFNDHKTGMIDQMVSLANLGNLSGFIGMLTDSRSFLSYARHEYFRRILCDLVGTWVENGEFPYDEELLKDIVCDISFENANKYFGFQK